MNNNESIRTLNELEKAEIEYEERNRNEKLKVLLIQYKVRVERLNELFKHNKSFSNGFSYQYAELKTLENVIHDLEGLLK